MGTLIYSLKNNLLALKTTVLTVKRKGLYIQTWLLYKISCLSIQAVNYRFSNTIKKLRQTHTSYL